MMRLVLALMWVLQFLPLRALGATGRTLGRVLYAFARERRAVVMTNLQLCFPELDDQAHKTLARRHFQALGRSLLERAVLWWGSRERIAQVMRLEGVEHWRVLNGQPVIFLAPHFVGMEMGGTRLLFESAAITTIYSRQKNPLFDAVLLRGRARFSQARIHARQDGVRPIIRALRDGLSLYYLPDMDLGHRDALFAPFFGVEAATVTGLSRIAAISGAAVVPCITRQLAGGEGYEVRLYPKWEQFPSGDLAADVRRMNAFIEERVREMPEQYYWVHKRFKTRPQGERSPYEQHATAD
jgi:KDO2-lipid IV(A) lauroyltransferase